MDTVSLGKHNPRLADIRKAIDRGTLTRDGLLPVEGDKLIREAEASGLEIAALFTRQGTRETISHSRSAIYALEPAIFKRIQSTETSQGTLALVRPPAFKIADVLPKSGAGPLVVLAGLQDPGNVGTILRVAESFGASGCVALPGTASNYNPKTVRASSGSIFRLPHVWDLSLADLVSNLHAAQIPLVGASPHAARSVTDWDWRKPAALLIGNEGSGLDEQQIGACKALLRIPQRGQMESLNSAVAAAIILYEAFRSRGGS